MSNIEIKAFVVGLHHHNNALVFDCGMPVSVVFDEENQHSDCAFKVLTEGGLMGGYLAESQFYWGSLATKLGAKLSFELKALINQGYTISEAVVEEIRGRALKYTKVVLKITLNEPETTHEAVSEEIEEDNMSVKVIGSKDGLFTLVGVQYYTDEVEIGQKVVLEVKNNTTFGIDENGEPLGVFPQKDSKCDAVIELNCPLTRNSEIKNDASSFDKEYIVVGFITETKGNKVSKYAVLQLKSVVEATEEDKEELYMERTIQYGFTKMAELQTLYDAENIVEEVVEPETELEVVKTVTTGENMLKSRIDEIKEQIDAKETELNQLKADLEMYEQELANVEHRNALISEIKEYIFGLDTKDIETIHEIVMNDVQSSSTPEEDTSSSNKEESVPEVVQKVHEGKELTLPEWEEYVEAYWEKGFNALRKQEKELNTEDNRAVKHFINKIKRFNKQLNLFKNQGYDKILTLYWIEDVTVIKTVCNQFNLSATRLTGSCIMKDNDITFFLEGN